MKKTAAWEIAYSMLNQYVTNRTLRKPSQQDKPRVAFFECGNGIFALELADKSRPISGAKFWFSFKPDLPIDIEVGEPKNPTQEGFGKFHKLKGTPLANGPTWAVRIADNPDTALARIHKVIQSLQPVAEAGKSSMGPPSEPKPNNPEMDDSTGRASSEASDDAGDDNPNQPTRILREVLARRGAPEFRNQLIKSYGGKCAVTGCSTLAALEAAHISPYAESFNNAASNGILLRSDIHTLFDLHLISINPESWSFEGHPSVLAGYPSLQFGNRINLPSIVDHHPSRSAIRDHYDQFLEIKNSGADVE